MRFSPASYRLSVLLVFTFIAGTIFVGFPTKSEALMLFRCDGLIQYRPCDSLEPLILARMTETVSPSVEPASYYAGKSPLHHVGGSPLYARVLNASFKRRPNGDGWWYGSIEGNGQLVLWLRLKGANGFTERRYMGKVWLSNKETTFNFVSVTPRMKKWDWDIEAEARPESD